MPISETKLNISKITGLQAALDAKSPTNHTHAIAPLIRPDQIIAYINRRLQGNEQLILMTGVGASYPMLRSHTILNNLHSVLDKIPLVMFFPGSYDGNELRLFNTFKDDNYYRAFPLCLISRF
jgi:Domain of unknown function (DUF1788)